MLLAHSTHVEIYQNLREALTETSHRQCDTYRPLPWSHFPMSHCAIFLLSFTGSFAEGSPSILS